MSREDIDAAVAATLRPLVIEPAYPRDPDLHEYESLRIARLGQFIGSDAHHALRDWLLDLGVELDTIPSDTAIVRGPDSLRFIRYVYELHRVGVGVERGRIMNTTGSGNDRNGVREVVYIECPVPRFPDAVYELAGLATEKEDG